jgi:subtilisin family serine protease
VGGEVADQTEKKDETGTPVPLGAGALPMYIPTDPLLGEQIHIVPGDYDDVDINITDIWDEYRGTGIVIGIVDDGVQWDHPDLIANYDTTIDYDGYGGDDDAAAEGEDWHGTAVAGLIAADDNGFGVVGAAPDSTITGYRLSFGEDATHEMYLESLFLQSQVDISNNSWGFPFYFHDNFNDPVFSEYEVALRNAVENGRDGLGTIWVFAAGNGHRIGDDANFHNLVNSRYTIAVSSSSEDGGGSVEGNQGAPLFGVVPVDGGSFGITKTTDRTGVDGINTDADGDYIEFGHSSGAAAVTSGVIALMLEANGDLGYRDVQEILLYSSHRSEHYSTFFGRDEQFAVKDWNGGRLGWHGETGPGVIDAHAAVRLAESWQKQSTLANELSVEASDDTSRSIPDHGWSQSSPSGRIEPSVIIEDSFRVQWVEVVTSPQRLVRVEC